jgi:hypothetical protein
MTDLRRNKVDGIANGIPDQDVSQGQAGGKLAVVGWGSTFGPIHQAVRRARAKGRTSSTSTSATSGRCRRIWASCSRAMTASWCPK